MGYVEQAKLPGDPGFQYQVRIAMFSAATAIQNEAIAGRSNAQYDKRQFLASQVLNNSDVYLARFSWAVAQDASVVRAAPVPIASSTNATPVVVTTGVVHGLAVGSVVTIGEHLVNVNANGAWTVIAIGSTTTFTIPAAGSGVGGATGWVVKLPSDAAVQNVVNGVWDDIAGIRQTD